MIAANELRIGNWVTNGEKCYTVDVNMLYDIATLEYYPIEPIALTPSILEKCGFAPMSQEVKDEFDMQFTERLVYKDTAICCHWDRVEWIFHYGFDADLGMAACEYVHQIQNLIFAFTQTELNITL